MSPKRQNFEKAARNGGFFHSNPMDLQGFHKIIPQM
jgi:hypothetical protein